LLSTDSATAAESSPGGTNSRASSTGSRNVVYRLSETPAFRHSASKEMASYFAYAASSTSNSRSA